MTIFSAWMLGMTIDRASLFALIFSIGILVDDAIVVTENIYRLWLIDNENIIATEPNTGIGAIYGPIIPLTAAIGTKAATTVKVAKIVGLPTS
jgi:multidrug efflux pump subunit AcrB